LKWATYWRPDPVRLGIGSLGEQPKQSDQKQQARDCSEHGRGKSVSRPGRWWIFGPLAAAGVPFGVGHRVAWLAFDCLAC
jgi:hypothetical protein